MVSEFISLSLKIFFMAEINVQTKKQTSSSSWLWILIVLAIVAAAAYFLMRNNETVKNEVNDATSYTSYSLTMENKTLKCELW
jgi:hypothetical protein